MIIPNKLELNNKKEINDKLLTYSIRLSRVVSIQMQYGYIMLNKINKENIEIIIKDVLENTNILKNDNIFPNQKSIEIDEQYSIMLFKNTLKMQEKSKTLILKYLKSPWTWESLDITLKSIFLIFTSEMVLNTKANNAILSSEYTRIATYFFSDKITGFVNAILDNLINNHRNELMNEYSTLDFYK